MTVDRERERLAATFDRAGRVVPASAARVPDRPLRPPAPDHPVVAGHACSRSVRDRQGDPPARGAGSASRAEPGAALAAAARANLADFDVDVVEARFEDWTPAGEPFAMLFAATAWHWIDPDVRYRKAADALEPAATLRGAVHVIRATATRSSRSCRRCTTRSAALRRRMPLPRPQELDDDRDEIEASGLFEVVDITQYDWETVYDAAGYMLNTFSGHIAMQEWQRDRLYREIRRRLGTRSDGVVRRHWGGVLQIARRRST